MKTYLVTGGAGFIGSNFVLYMLKKYEDIRIINLDKLTYAGNLENLKSIENDKRHIFVHGDICDAELVSSLFEKYEIDYVAHFAAESHVDNSIKNPNIFAETNILGTMNLLNAAKYMRDVENHPLVRYHQVSTDEVYGDLPLDRPDLKFTEETPIHTSSPYSASKASADLEVLAYARTFKLPITISRCSNNYGPYQFPEKLIPLMVSKALNNESLPVYGTGENVRDWIHVHDHNVGVDMIVRHGKEGEIYNLGGHSERTNIEMVKTILKQLGKPESLITFVQDRAGHDRRYAIDSTKAERELGWNRSYTFDEGIKETINWYVDNQEWIDDIKSGSYRNSYKG